MAFQGKYPPASSRGRRERRRTLRLQGELRFRGCSATSRARWRRAAALPLLESTPPRRGAAGYTGRPHRRRRRRRRRPRPPPPPPPPPLRPAVAARRKTLPLTRVLLLAAEHVEVRRADPCAWRLLADTLTALADLPPSGGGGGAPAALWWTGVRDWWVGACFHDAEAPVVGSAEELRSERARTARALQAALGGDEDAELAAVAGI